MARIRVDVTEPVIDGMEIRFKAPCNCTEVEGLTVYYSDNAHNHRYEFDFRDANGQDVTGVGNLFVTGAYLTVLLDTNGLYAYIVNATNNSYIAGVLGDIGTILDSINGEEVL